MAGFKEFAHEIRKRATDYPIATVQHVAMYAKENNRVYIIDENGGLVDFEVANISCYNVDVSGNAHIGGVIDVSGDGHFWSDLSVEGDVFLSGTVYDYPEFNGVIGSSPQVGGIKQIVTYDQTGVGGQSNAKSNEFGLRIVNETNEPQDYTTVNIIKLTSLQVDNLSGGSISTHQLTPLRTEGYSFSAGVSGDYAYGALIQRSGIAPGAFVDTHIDLYLQGLDNSGLVNNRWGIYQEDPLNANYFAGEIESNSNIITKGITVSSPDGFPKLQVIAANATDTVVSTPNVGMILRGGGASPGQTAITLQNGANIIMEPISGKVNVVGVVTESVESLSFISGGTTTATTRYLFNKNTSTIASYTVNFPASPVNGQPFTFATRGALTLVTIGGGTANTIPGSMLANATWTWVYNLDDSIWMATNTGF